MPPDRRSSQDAFYIDMLDPRVLDTPDELNTALRAIEAVCHRGDLEIAEMIAALDSRPYLLEYIISMLEEGAYEKLSKWILVTGFPASTTPNMVDTMSMRLLGRFSSSLLSAKYPSAAGASPNLRVFYKKVELSFDVLKALEENADSALTGGNVSPVRRKKGRAVTNNRRIDPQPFDSMRIAVPTTGAEVRDVRVRVLSQLQNILENYLLALRKPLVSDAFKSSYTRAEQSPHDPAPPTIQPMRVALYLDNVEGFGEWPIILSGRAQKDLRSVNHADGAMFRIVMEKIKQLSQGYFSRANQKSLTGHGTKLPIYRARMPGDKRLVYQIDCGPDFRNSHAANPQHECQVIRVFGIFTHGEIRRKQFWDTLSQQLQRRGSDYIERCTFQDKPLSPDENSIPPAQFPPSSYQVQDIPQVAPLIKPHEEDMKAIHSMLVLDKFFMLSQALVNGILADKEVTHVFSVCGQEQEIIEHPGSCYVIGRSGTGKTTTMLFKMLSIQRTLRGHPKPRQVFVTQSRVLAMKVGEYFAKLMSSLEAAACSPEELRMLELDVKRDTGLINQNDNKRWRSDLPECFSELRDEHFPMFITYDRLCTMIQGDIGPDNDNDGFVIPKLHVHGDDETPPTSPTQSRKSRFHMGSENMSSSDYMQQSHRNFVSYGEFLASYWDHLPQNLTRGLDPALVFREFMGVIKGSEGAIGTKNRCLDRESYKSLSVRNQGTFSHKRDDIYDLFMAYTKLKRQRQDYDAADRTQYILKELREVGLAGQKVDFLYVDEVQDNLLIDTLVLRSICANQHGLFWAGDTAQTISVGSSFRFADLKAYQYRIERQLSRELGYIPVEPRAFELGLNYRSHGGIVNCARSIIDLITRYWQYSIDILQPEWGIIDGFPPMFFASQGDAALEKAFPKNEERETVDFGANQCILVRNDTVKDRLKQRLRGSVIMTLYESKGQEFNEVLLYNFFEDSTATVNQWRLVLNGLSEGGDLLDAPTFDETRHASICTELKFLYVAITRARDNLWIMDSSESAEPMKLYWKDRIEIWPSAEIPCLAGSSSSEEWSKTGKTMFDGGHYEQASVAYLRAGQNQEAAICDAYLLREKARLTSTTASAARSRAFIAAANAFITCAKDQPPELTDGRLAYYETAGDCYLESRDPDYVKNAGDSYWMAERYTAAARAYREGECFDEMAEVIIQHGDALESGLLERLTGVARMYYFKRLNVKAALKLFPSAEDALGFLEDYDMDEARLKLLKELGRIREAAGIYAKNGELLKAVEMLTVSAAHNASYARPAVEYLLTGLRRYLTLGVLTTSNPIASKLLALADQLDKRTVPKQEVNELAMFRAIQRTNNVTLCALAKTFIGAGNDVAALLCLDHVFSSPLELQNLPLTEVQSLLSLYLAYVRLLHQFWRDGSLAEGSNHQRLFGFQVLGENRYLVPKYTLLHEKLTDRSGPGKRGVDGYRCSYDELFQAIIRLISSRSRGRTEIQNSVCRDVYGFSPCLRLLVQRKCDPPKDQGPCPFHHIQPEELTVDWYHTRLHLILLQFKILDSARYYDIHVTNYWLRILYSALHPPYQRLGSLANLDIDSIPDGADSFRIIRERVRHACYDIRYNYPGPADRSRQWFTVACALAFDFDRENAREFVPCTPMYRSPLWPRSLFRGGNLIVQDLIAFVTAKTHHSLTLGSLYLREVLRSGLRADVNVLCDLAERLSGLFIMACRVNSRGGILYNVTLPRSWFVNLISPGTDLRKDMSTFSTFAETMIELMQKIDAQAQRYRTSPPDAEQFIADGRRMTSFMGSFYIARICFYLCLVGYNKNDDGLKKKILTGIRSLRKEDGKPIPWIYRHYVDANGWNGLVNAFTESLRNSLLDEMILLLHPTIPGPRGWRSKYVRVVSHNRLDEVPGLLLSTMQSAPRSGITPAHQQPHAETTGARPNDDQDGQEEQKHIDIPEEMITDREEAEVVTSGGDHEEEIDETRVNAAKVIQYVYRRHLERKRAGAARKIQAACRHYLRRKNIIRMGIDATQAHYWHLLHRRSKEMEWTKDSRYHLLFRVPLAYILVCLDAIKTFAESEKKEAKDRVMKGDNKELEDLTEALDNYSKLLKKTIALQNRLSPSSEFHEKKSVSDLQNAIQEVKVVVEGLHDIPESIGTRNQIKKRWDRGWKWIFEKQGSRAKGKKAEKPRLVIDPEDLLYM